MYGDLLPFFTLSRIQAMNLLTKVKIGKKCTHDAQTGKHQSLQPTGVDWLSYKAFRLKLRQLTANFKIFRNNNDSTFQKCL